MITVHANFHSHFKELASTGEASFQIETPTVKALAESICEAYGPKMKAMLIDPDTHELNERGTMFVDAKGMRISMSDQLSDGDTITFLVGIAGG